MTLRVIGSGFGRTGTRSLQLALETLLEGKVHHMFVVRNPENASHMPLLEQAYRDEDFAKSLDWSLIFGDFVACCDFPTSPLWPYLMAAYPAALIVHTERDFESWYASCQATIFNKMAPPGGADATPWDKMMIAMREATIPADFGDKEAILEIYERYRQRVLDEVPPERLLLFRVTDGWGPLCEKLGVPVPDMPFPHTNTTEQFRASFVKKPAE